MKFIALVGRLNDQISIKVVTAPLFIATKLEAYHTRG
jgi:hypothetical protein